MSRVGGSKRPVATKAVDQAWRDDSSVNKRACKREGKCPHDQTTRAVFDNLRDEPRDLVDVVEIGGLTMRQAILRDKERNAEQAGSVRFGKLYYKNLKKQYRQAMRPASCLPQGLQPEPVLFQAMVSLMSSPSDRQPLRDYVAGAVRMGQAEIVCLIKALGQLSPTTSREQLNTMVSVARCLMRVGAQDRYPGYINEIFPLLDRTLVQALRVTPTLPTLSNPQPETLAPVLALSKGRPTEKKKKKFARKNFSKNKKKFPPINFSGLWESNPVSNGENWIPRCSLIIRRLA